MIVVGEAVKLFIEQLFIIWLTETTTVLVWATPVAPYAVNVYVVPTVGYTACEPFVFTVPRAG